MIRRLFRRGFDGLLVLGATFVVVFAVCAPLTVRAAPIACAHLTVTEALWRAVAAWSLVRADACMGRSELTDLASSASLYDGLWARAPDTLMLVIPALILGFAFGAAFALFAAARAGRPSDRLLMSVAVLGASVPACVLAPIVIEVVAVRLSLAPVLYGSGASVLPILTLALMPAGAVARRLRGALVRQAQLPYVKVAQAQGFSPRFILLRRVLPGALRETVGALPAVVATAVAGTVVVETVFLRSGLGTLFLRAALARDSNVLAVLVLWGTLLFVVMSLLVDEWSRRVDDGRRL